MPWSNQGGGPWGSGGKGPWGSGPQSSGPTPPDLEELLRRSQDKLRAVLPGGNLSGRGFALIALVAVVLWGFSGFFRVEVEEAGVVLRFGRYVRDVQPGLNYHLPFPIETARTPSLRVVYVNIGKRVDERSNIPDRDIPEERLMLTGDGNIVDLGFRGAMEGETQRRERFLFNLEKPAGTVKAVAESAMREVIGRTNSSDIQTNARQRIEVEVQELMQKMLDLYGADLGSRCNWEKYSAGSG